MYVSVKDTICNSAVFVDTVNAGKAENPTWVGAQSLGSQLYILFANSIINVIWIKSPSKGLISASVSDQNVPVKRKCFN